MAGKVKNAAAADTADAAEKLMDDEKNKVNDREKKKKKSGLFSRMWNLLVLGFRGADDSYFEKRLQLIAKEEEVVSARLRRRSQTWKRIIRNLILLSVFLEVIAVCYAIMTTKSLDLNWKMRALRVLPIFLLPALSFIIYSGLVRFTRMCDRKDQKTLDRLQAERQAKIDELKERTNYYITQQLIQKYDPNPVAKAAAATVLASKLGADSGLKVHLGDEPTYTAPTGKSHDVQIVPSDGLQNRKQLHTRSGGKESSEWHYSGKEMQQAALSEGPEASNQLVVEHYNQQGSSANDGGWFARIAALLVVEDPTQSCALICGNCHMHNGLAKKEDFPYITYYCPHCKALNRPKQIDEHVSISNSPHTSSSTSVGDVDTASFSERVPTSSSPVSAAVETTVGSNGVASGSPVN